MSILFPVLYGSSFCVPAHPAEVRSRVVFSSNFGENKLDVMFMFLSAREIISDNALGIHWFLWLI